MIDISTVEKVIIGSGIASLEEGVLSGFTSLEEVILSSASSELMIPEDCFKGCTSLKHFEYQNNK